MIFNFLKKKDGVLFAEAFKNIRGKQNAPWQWKNLQQISKQIRGYDDRIGLLEEMADAYICLNFLESIFDIKPDDLQKAIDVKLERERRNCQ